MERLTKALARTPLHHWHAAQGAHFIARNGWQIAASYSDGSGEAVAIRAGLGLVDLCASSKIEFQGRGVTALVDALVADHPAWKPGRGMVYNAGGV